MSYKKVFILPDQHYTHEGSEEGGCDATAESISLLACSQFKPDIFVNLGDCGEWNSVSPWRYKRRRRPPIDFVLKDLESEAASVRTALGKWSEVVPKGCRKIFTMGNHEIWVNNLVEEVPQLGRAGYLPQDLMGLKKFGYRWYPYGEYVRLGKLWLYHGGHWAGKHHTSQHLAHLGASVVYGHTHDIQYSSQSSLGGPHGAWSVGCIAHLEKAFLKGRKTTWEHAFAVAFLEKNGNFNLQVCRIQDGVTYLEGKRIEL